MCIYIYYIYIYIYYIYIYIYIYIKNNFNVWDCSIPKFEIIIVCVRVKDTC